MYKQTYPDAHTHPDAHTYIHTHIHISHIHTFTSNWLLFTPFAENVHLIVADAHEYVERHRTTLLRKFANFPQKRHTLETYNTTETNNLVLIHRSPRPWT